LNFSHEEQKKFLDELKRSQFSRQIKEKWRKRKGSLPAPSTLKKWRLKHAKGEGPKKPGLQKALVEEDITSLKDEIKARVESGDAPSTEQLEEMINDAGRASARRRALKFPLSGLSPTSMRVYKRQVGVEPRKAAHKSKARVCAERDMRNFVSFAVLMSVLLATPGRVVPPSLIFNIDATCFSVGADKHTKVWIVPENRNMGVPIAKEEKTQQAMYGKLYVLLSASGECSAMILVLHDKGLESDSVFFSVEGS